MGLTKHYERLKSGDGEIFIDDGFPTLKKPNGSVFVQGSGDLVINDISASNGPRLQFASETTSTNKDMRFEMNTEQNPENPELRIQNSTDGIADDNMLFIRWNGEVEIPNNALILANLTEDPENPPDGGMWYRSDL